MRAVVLETYGDPDVLVLREVPDPSPGPEEVLVAVHATALNRADLLQRRGLYSGPPMEHEIPGLELAGTVIEAGPRVDGVGVGDEVMGIVGGGAYAERLVTHHRQVVPVPPAVGLADAAAVPEVFITAWDALVVQGGLTSGRRALVHAGASGVGTAAIQVAKAIGARVAVTASAPKHDVCHRLGADLVIDYRAQDFAHAVRDWTGAHGVDVVLDVVGGDYLDRNVDCVTVGGTIVQVGTMGGLDATFSLTKMLGKRCSLVGTVLRARPIEEKIAITQRFGAEVLPLLDDGTLRPVIDSRFPLEEAADAHRRMEANENAGKILLDVGAGQTS